MLWQILFRVDQLVLATVSNAHSLGIYNAATKIAEVPNVFAGVLYLTLLGRLSDIAKDGTGQEKHKLRKVFYTYLLIGCLAALFVFIFAPVLVWIIFGNQFVEAAGVLRVYAFTIPGMFMIYHYFSLLSAKQLFLPLITVFSVVSVLDIVFTLILYPLFGLLGVAFGTVCAYTILSVLFYLYFMKFDF
jgi:O-antigen/teichoic acid export membrane protein